MQCFKSYYKLGTKYNLRTIIIYRLKIIFSSNLTGDFKTHFDPRGIYSNTFLLAIINPKSNTSIFSLFYSTIKNIIYTFHYSFFFSLISNINKNKRSSYHNYPFYQLTRIHHKNG